MKLRNLLVRLYNFLFSRQLYVIADPADSSITVSRRLFRHMHLLKLQKAKVFVFRVPGNHTYGFTANPNVGNTQLCDVQYNTKYRCIGFETLCPTVHRIFFDYHLPHHAPVKLSVRVRLLPVGFVWYEIMQPRNFSGVCKKK